MKLMTILSTGAMCLAGCAPMQPTYWVKPGANQQTFNQAMARCRMQLAMVPATSRADLNMNTAAGQIGAAGRDFQDTAAQASFIDDCLTADGWTPQQQAPRPLMADIKADFRCLKANVREGDKVKSTNGEHVVVQSMMGSSSRCTDEKFPVLATVISP